MIQLQEEGGLRRRPPRPYRPVGASLIVPAKVLALTLSAVEPFGRRRLEACCFWYGPRDAADNGRVAAVVVPRQENTWGNYSVSSDAMAEVAAATRRFGWRNLTQVHTHPGRRIEHSAYDDDHANSRRALSLVFPFYGLIGGRVGAKVGVHEFQDGYWHLLGDLEAACRVQIVSGAEDVQILNMR